MAHSVGPWTVDRGLWDGRGARERERERGGKGGEGEGACEVQPLLLLLLGGGRGASGLNSTRLESVGDWTWATNGHHLTGPLAARQGSTGAKVGLLESG
jgi:hypothetical protein